MGLRDEIEVFDNVKISAVTGETDVWDRVIFPNAIRKREAEFILNLVDEQKPRRILEFGCGTGWISKILADKGYEVTGIDISKSLITSASENCSGKSEFIIGDCMRLPFQDGVFDLIVGVAILHHLDPGKGLSECYRVSTSGAALLLMEPNKYNPAAALGRKVAPLDTQTQDEEPFTPGGLTKIIESSPWDSQYIKYLFPYSFLIARILRKTRMDKQLVRFICPLITRSEKVFERIPLLNRLCWVIVVVIQRT